MIPIFPINHEIDIFMHLQPQNFDTSCLMAHAVLCSTTAERFIAKLSFSQYCFTKVPEGFMLATIHEATAELIIFCSKSRN